MLLLAMGLLLVLWFACLQPLYPIPAGGPHRHLAALLVAGATQEVEGVIRPRSGFAGGTGTAAMLNKPIRLERLDERTVAFADISHHAVRTVDRNVRVATVGSRFLPMSISLSARPAGWTDFPTSATGGFSGEGEAARKAPTELGLGRGESRPAGGQSSSSCRGSRVGSSRR